MDSETPKKHYSPHKRTRIVTAYDLGVSPKEIALKEGIPAGSVRGIASRYRVQKSAESSPRSSRPAVLSEREKRRIMRLIADDPFIQTRELLEKAELTCCAGTLLAWLKRAGVAHKTAIRRPKLSQENAEKRLRFAQAYVSQPIELWKRWIFSDETTVMRGDGERQAWVFCKYVPFLLILII